MKEMGSSSLSVVLVEPQIPPNTGNVARLCAALRLPLHLVGHLGFRLTDRYLKRAGLDYWEYVDFHHHPSIEQFFAPLPAESLHFFSKKAGSSYIDAHFSRGDYLIFGSETEGLPEWMFERYGDRFRSIPIMEKGVRSLNLSSAVAMVTGEAMRQAGLFE